MKSITKTIQGKEGMLFWIMVVSLVFCFAFYVYFLNNAISNAVVRGRLESAVTKLRSDVGELEARYISRKSAITLNYAEEYGFKEVAVTKFIARKSSGAIVSFNSGL